MLELKEWAEERDAARLAQELEEELLELCNHKQGKKLDKQDYRLQELHEKVKYNLKYREEKENYLRDRNAKVAYLNLVYPC